MDASDLGARLAQRSGGMPSAVAIVTPSGTRVVRHDCAAQADFEIGSISKGVTGLLYVDAVTRGEVRPETRLGELLPLAESPAADIPLASLAIHRSGLPRSIGGHTLRRSWAYLRHGINPYDGPLDELYADARRAKLGRPRPRYSNAGFQLFGQALAVAAGCTYAALVHRRIAEPLGLEPFYVPNSPGDLLPTALPGHRGRRVIPPWASEAVAPAGGVRASAGAMADFARALLQRAAPGMAALDPVADFAGPAMRIGAGWMVTDRRGQGVLTWHNGGTGGFRSWLGLRRDAGLAVVALGASTRAMDPLGLSVLADAESLA